MSGVVPLDVERIDLPTMLTAIAQADAARDMTPVWRLIQPLIEESRLPRQHVLAMVLFRLSMNAADTADHRAEAILLQRMRENCSTAAIESAVLSGLLNLGSRQGWLASDPYQQLADRINQLPDGHPARLLFATISRGRRPP
jgi:hypothetical protein